MWHLSDLPVEYSGAAEKPATASQTPNANESLDPVEPPLPPEVLAGPALVSAQPGPGSEYWLP